MTNTTYSLQFSRRFAALTAAALLALAFPSVHGAPPVGGAAIGAAGNLGIGVGQGMGAARMGAAGAGSFGGSARGVGSAQGGGAFSNAGGVSTAFDDTESIGMRQGRLRAQAGVTTGANAADAHASVMGEARGRSVATLAAGGASTSLNTAATVHAIQSQAMESREQLLAELHTRVDASAKAMTTVRESGAKLDGQAKADFKAASADVKAKEKALNQSMKAAEKADASTWVTARAKLAGDYDAYAAAVAHAETISHAEAKRANPPKS